MSFKTLARQWQKIARLQDWDISVEVLPGAKYDAAEVSWGWEVGVTNGYSLINSDRHDSKIFIRVDGPYPERTLVHEISHLLTDPIHQAALECLSFVHDKTSHEFLLNRINEGLESSVHAICRALMSAQSTTISLK